MLRVVRDALIIVLITLALGELSLRIYNFIDPLPIFYSESYNRWRGKPFAPEYGAFHLNSRGFNDVEFNTSKAPGATRILGIGDSFAFGVVPYEYNYLTLVEQNLKQHGRDVELINMGIPSIGPRDYLALLVHEGIALEPDRVLLSFFIGNDFEGQRRSLASYSYLASAVKYVAARWSKFDAQFAPSNAPYHDDAPMFTDAAYLNIELQRSAIFIRDNRKFERDFAAAMFYISEIKRLCDSRNIGLTLVLIPDEMQVSKPLQARLIAASGVAQASAKSARASTSFDFTLPNRLLRAKLEELKIDYIDLMTDFSARSLVEKLYRPNDSHWNIAGNSLAAELIGQYLSAQLAAGGR